MTQIASIEHYFFSKRLWTQSVNNFLKRAKKNSWGFETQDSLGLTCTDLANNSSAFRNVFLKSLKNGDFNFQPARSNEIFADKKRIIHKFNWLDTLILTHLAAATSKVICQHYPESLYSFIPGKSNIQAIKRVSAFIKSKNCRFYVLRRDIKSFGESLLHDITQKDFTTYTKASETLQNLFQQVCKFQYLNSEGNLVMNQRGLPNGCHLQLLMENLYLLNLDRDFSNNSDCLYTRYGDDIILATPSLEFALSAIDKMSSKFKEVGLTENAEKSGNFIVDKPHQLKQTHSSENSFLSVTSFPYLGAQISFNGDISLSQKKANTIRKQLRTQLLAVRRLITADFSEQDRLEILIKTAASFLGDDIGPADNKISYYSTLLLSENQLRELDLWIANMILKLALKNKWIKGNFRKYPPSQLRRLGLPSLLHKRRIGGI